MSTTSVGEIGLDLVVNQKQFDRQMAGITGLAKKAGAALAGAFAVKKVVDFGKQCLELGSNLSEVQNVVDVTFPKMTAKVDKFAQSAATSFGLSETMAKKYTGTFGAMAKAFGFSESAAYDMSTTLTGLAGDVASFYNLSQDEAYTKLKSVFTGETETLKDLGVVMTQAALDQYALANGYGKTTAAMTEQEKVALRYAFVQKQLSAAQGDFARTSDSWANQTRIMSLQLQSIMATIGQGLINLFTPAIKIINVVLGKIATLANAFKSFTDLITGNKSSGSSSVAAPVSELASAADSADGGLNSASGAAGNLAKSTKGVGAAAKKAAKEMRSLMGFDQVQKLNTQTDTSDGNGQGSGISSGTGSLGSAVDFGNLAEGETVIEKVDTQMSGLLKRAKELANVLKKGFKIGFGESERTIVSIRKSIDGIGDSLKDIFTDKSVVTAANNLADEIALSIGKIVGSAANIGLSLADNLIGGIDQYLKNNTGRIKDYLVNMFDIGSEIAGLAGESSLFLADIASIFQSDAAKQITTNIISFFANGFMGATEMAGRFGKDVIDLVVSPLTENSEAIKNSVAGFLEPIEKITGKISDELSSAFAKIKQMYDEHIAPMFDALKQGFTEIVGYLCETFESEIKPVLDQFAEDFCAVWDEHIQPAIDTGIEFIGKLADTISLLWDEYLQPFITRLIDGLAPALETAGEAFNTAFAAVGDLVSVVFDTLSQLLDFIVDVFAGDWDAAWQDLKGAFETLWNGVDEFLRKIWDGLCEFFEQTWENIQETFEPVIEWFSDLFDAAWQGINEAWSGACEFFAGIWSGITETFSGAKDWLTSIFKGAWEGITGVWDSAITWFTDNITEPLSSLFSDLWGGIESFATDTWDNIVGIFQAGGTIFDGFVTSVKDVFVQLVNGIIGGINSVISIPFNSLNNVLNGIKDISILGAKPFGWVPTISVPQIPKLAEGGFVRANAPQLAMIGDNRHQGEIVAPEDKLREMVDAAVKAAGTHGLTKDELDSIINRAVMRIVAALDQMGFYIDSEEIARASQKGNRSTRYQFNKMDLQ